MLLVHTAQCYIVLIVLDRVGIRRKAEAVSFKKPGILVGTINTCVSMQSAGVFYAVQHRYFI